MKTPGEVAYQAWRERTKRALSAGTFEFDFFLAAWNGLPESAKTAWEEIAGAAIDANYEKWGPDKCRNCR